LQRRHLFVWAIFAPKYVFDVAGSVVVDAALMLLPAVVAITYGVRSVIRRRTGNDVERKKLR
jgi:hypothetical protein